MVYAVYTVFLLASNILSNHALVRYMFTLCPKHALDSCVFSTCWHSIFSIRNFSSPIPSIALHIVVHSYLLCLTYCVCGNANISKN